MLWSCILLGFPYVHVSKAVKKNFYLMHFENSRFSYMFSVTFNRDHLAHS